RRMGGALPAVHLDCAHWPRGSATARSGGKLLRVAQALPVSEGAAERQPARLELVVTFDTDVPPAEVWLQVNRLLQALALAAPDLKLTYDALHSRAEDGDVVIALTTPDAGGAAGRLEGLSTALRRAVGKNLAIRAVRLAA